MTQYVPTMISLISKWTGFVEARALNTATAFRFTYLHACMLGCDLESTYMQSNLNLVADIIITLSGQVVCI